MKRDRKSFMRQTQTHTHTTEDTDTSWDQKACSRLGEREREREREDGDEDRDTQADNESAGVIIDLHSQVACVRTACLLPCVLLSTILNSLPRSPSPSLVTRQDALHISAYLLA